jgi:hypothetical protein
MGNLRKTAFLKEGLSRLFGNEQEYLKRLIRALLSIQNSGDTVPMAPQSTASACPKDEGKKDEV